MVLSTVKTDDVTSGRRDVDPHGRLRGEWINESVITAGGALDLDCEIRNFGLPQKHELP